MVAIEPRLLTQEGSAMKDGIVHLSAFASFGVIKVATILIVGALWSYPVGIGLGLLLGLSSMMLVYEIWRRVGWYDHRADPSSNWPRSRIP